MFSARDRKNTFITHTIKSKPVNLDLSMWGGEEGGRPAFPSSPLPHLNHQDYELLIYVVGEEEVGQPPLPQHKLLTFNPGGTRGGGAGIKILR